MQTSVVPLTKEIYEIQRGQYASLSDRHLQQFEAILGSDRAITEPSEVAPHNVDWFKTVRGTKTYNIVFIVSVMVIVCS